MRALVSLIICAAALAAVAPDARADDSVSIPIARGVEHVQEEIAGVRQNHVAAQVWWRGRWHYVDPTWGVLFERHGSVLGPEQVAKLKRPHQYAVMNTLVPWTYASTRRGGGWDPLSYLTEARARQVVMNGAGTVRPPRTGTVWDLSLMTLPAGRHRLTLASKGKLCGGLGVLHVGPVDVPFASVPDAGPLTVALPAAATTVTLWADGGDPAEPCAVLLAGLSAS